jgi:hypothetical protein
VVAAIRLKITLTIRIGVNDISIVQRGYGWQHICDVDAVYKVVPDDLSVFL